MTPDPDGRPHGATSADEHARGDSQLLDRRPGQVAPATAAHHLTARFAHSAQQPSHRSTANSCSTVGDPVKPSSVRYNRQASPTGASGSENGSRPSTRTVGEPRNCAASASSGVETKTCSTASSGRPTATSAVRNRSSATCQFGQPAKYRSEIVMTVIVLRRPTPTSADWKTFGVWGAHIPNFNF